MIQSNRKRTKQEYPVLIGQGWILFDPLTGISYVSYMAIREIIKIPDAKLREISKPIEQVDAAVLKLLDDMAETMYDAPGIGLAAIQIAEPIRALLVDVTERAETEDGEEKTEPDPALEKELRNPIFMINPEIVAFSEAPSTYEEGCLSIPDYFAEVDRPAGCTVTYIDRDGKEQVLEAEGLLSTCIQHEIDHLNGKLFIDLLSKLKRDMVIKKFTKAAKQAGKLPEKRMIG